MRAHLLWLCDSPTTPTTPPLDNGVTPLTQTGAAQRKCGKKRQTVSKLAKKAVRVGKIIAISQVNNVNCGERSHHQKYHLQRKFLLTVDLCSFLNLWTWCFPYFWNPKLSFLLQTAIPSRFSVLPPITHWGQLKGRNSCRIAQVPEVQSAFMEKLPVYIYHDLFQMPCPKWWNLKASSYCAEGGQSWFGKKCNIIPSNFAT